MLLCGVAANTVMMKHVLVVNNHGESSSFLEAQRLRDADTGPYVDHSFRDALDRVFRAADRQKALGGDQPASVTQTVDGIQFYHFKNKFPAGNPGHFIGPEHLDYWSSKLTKKLHERHETLDAIVIPAPDCNLHYDRMKRWLADMRAEWPEVKVMVVSPPVKAGYGQQISYRQLFPREVKGKPISAIEHAPGIDAVVFPTNQQPSDNHLRDLLGMRSLPPLRNRG